MENSCLRVQKRQRPNTRGSAGLIDSDMSAGTKAELATMERRERDANHASGLTLTRKVREGKA